MKLYAIALLLLILCSALYSQQLADTSYHPIIQNPEYDLSEGPVVFIDEGHHNFHTKNGRYKAFANLLERDGYLVKEYAGLFEKERLAKGKILVISNALHESNVEDWFLPNPSAFTKAEIAILKEWVSEGGSLFLIADHMPIAGCAIDLAAAFGFEFTNGFVFNMVTKPRSHAFFNRKDTTLMNNSITNGRDSSERVEQVVSFTGQAFSIPDDAHPILVFNDDYLNYLPDTAWVFEEKTPKLKVEGWSQGAYKKYGKGRVVAFGEAAMFSAQLAGPQKSKMGMNNEVAPENYQLLLNIIHWLDGGLD